MKLSNMRIVLCRRIIQCAYYYTVSVIKEKPNIVWIYNPCSLIAIFMVFDWRTLPPMLRNWHSFQVKISFMYRNRITNIQNLNPLVYSFRFLQNCILLLEIIRKAFHNWNISLFKIYECSIFWHFFQFNLCVMLVRSTLGLSYCPIICHHFSMGLSRPQKAVETRSLLRTKGVSSFLSEALVS